MIAVSFQPFDDGCESLIVTCGSVDIMPDGTVEINGANAVFPSQGIYTIDGKRYDMVSVYQAHRYDDSFIDEQQFAALLEKDEQP